MLVQHGVVVALRPQDEQIDAGDFASLARQTVNCRSVLQLDDVAEQQLRRQARRAAHTTVRIPGLAYGSASVLPRLRDRFVLFGRAVFDGSRPNKEQTNV